MAVAFQTNPALIGILVIIAAAVIIVLLIAGCAFLIRRFVKEHGELTDRQKAVWKNTLERLGLEEDVREQSAYFDVAGKYRKRKVKISFPAVSDGESTDISTVCEAFFSIPLDIIFEIKSEGEINQALKAVFEENKVKLGLPDFEDKFAVICQHQERLRQILTSDLSGGKTQNPAADLILVKESVEYIKITDESVYLKNKGQLLEINEIKPLLDAAVYLAERFETAAGETGEKFS